MSNREQQKLARRGKIILAAKDLFLEQGIQQVQLQDVANTVGIGIATLYRYFPNKEQLIIAVNNNITSQMTVALQQIITQQHTTYAQIEHILDYYIDFVDDPEHRFVKFFKAFENYKPQMNANEDYAEYLSIRRRLADVLLTIVQKDKQDGSIRTDIDLDTYIITVVHNMSYFMAESTLTNHDPTLPVELNPKKQLFILKDMFLAYIRPIR